MSKPQKSLPQLITREPLATRLGLKPKTLANWANQGKGPRCIRLEGGYAVYDERDVAAWLESQGVKL